VVPNTFFSLAFHGAFFIALQLGRFSGTSMFFEIIAGGNNNTAKYAPTKELALGSCIQWFF
jgi:hypothetical protein